MNTSPFYEEPSDQLVSLANLAKRDYPEEFNANAGANTPEALPTQQQETEKSPDEGAVTPKSTLQPLIQTQQPETEPTEAVGQIVDTRSEKLPADTEIQDGDSTTKQADEIEEEFREKVQEEQQETLTSLV